MIQPLNLTNMEDTFNKLEWDHDDGIFLPMLNDVNRNKFYNSILAQHAMGKTVLDIGTGTGLLSVLAIQHGASKVYTVEQDFHRAKLAKYVIKQLGLEEQIIVLWGNFFDLRKQDDVDFAITETIGGRIFEEGCLDIAQQVQSWDIPIYPELMHLDFCLHNAEETISSNQIWQDPQVKKEFNPGISISSKFVDEINTIINYKYSQKGIEQPKEDTIVVHSKSAKKLNEVYARHSMGTVDFNSSIDNNDLVFEVELELTQDFTTSASIQWQMQSGSNTLDCRDTTWSIPVAQLNKVHPRFSVQYIRKTRNWTLTMI